MIIDATSDKIITATSRIATARVFLFMGLLPFPDELKNAQYYRYGDNKTERAAAQYWEAIKG